MLLADREKAKEPEGEIGVVRVGFDTFVWDRDWKIGEFRIEFSKYSMFGWYFWGKNVFFERMIGRFWKLFWNYFTRFNYFA